MSPTLRRCPIAAWAHSRNARPAVLWPHGQWTYGQLETLVRGWVEVFRRRGVVENDRVVAWAWNHPRLVAQLFALGRLGAALVPLNARLTEHEIKGQLHKVNPRLVVAEQPFIQMKSESNWLDAEAGQREAEKSASSSSEAPTLDLRQVAAVLFTSGTTGQAKAALLTWGNFWASAQASEANLGPTENQRWLATLPLFHVGGLAMVTRCALGGGSLVIHRQFDVEAVNKALDSGGITHASFVASTLARMMVARGGGPFPSSFRAALVGGAAVSGSLLTQARALGCQVLQTYGLTEACSQVTTECPDEADGETAGPPLFGVSVRIVNEDREPIAVGQAGAIEVQGSTVMRGYWEDEQATREALADGWLRTGDWGALDQRGRLKVYSRRTDLIISGGENIYPAEVEAVLQAHPAVQQALVLPWSDEVWGQVPVALISGTETASPAELDAWCRKQLAGFKVPKRYLSVDSIPLNALGKPDRREAERLAKSVWASSVSPRG